jgi:hypothetical protein
MASTHRACGFYYVNQAIYGSQSVNGHCFSVPYRERDYCNSHKVTVCLVRISLDTRTEEKAARSGGYIII